MDFFVGLGNLCLFQVGSDMCKAGTVAKPSAELATQRAKRLGYEPYGQDWTPQQMSISHRNRQGGLIRTNPNPTSPADKIVKLPSNRNSLPPLQVPRVRHQCLRPN